MMPLADLIGPGEFRSRSCGSRIPRLGVGDARRRVRVHTVEWVRECVCQMSIF